MSNRQRLRSGARNRVPTGRAGVANLIDGPAAGTRGAAAQQTPANPTMTGRTTRAAARAQPPVASAPVEAPICTPDQVEQALNQNPGVGNQAAGPQASTNPQPGDRTTRAAAAARRQARAVAPRRRLVRAPRPPVTQVQAPTVAPNQATQALNQI